MPNNILFITALIVAVLVAYRVFFSTDRSDQIAENRKAGVTFMNQNFNAEGVVTTSSGLQYQILREGTGLEHPSAVSKVKVHYEGKLLDDYIFDSSIARGEPISFKLNQVIRGWAEGLQLMVVGEKTRFFIPADLAYGDRATGPIPPGSTLIFDVELLDIENE